MTYPARDREPLTLDEIATAAAAVIADARAADLMPPFALNVHDYPPPTASLQLYAPETDTTEVWAALWRYADVYGTRVTTRPGVRPGTVHASARFQRDGITYEINAILHTDDDQPGQDQAA